MGRFVPVVGLDERIAERFARPRLSRILDMLQDEARKRAPEVKVWLCLAPDTPVIARGVTYAARRRHVGPAVSVATTSGRRLTLTPEHLVLTARGWHEAQCLHQGDHLVHVRDTGTSRTPDVENHPPLIGEVVDAAIETMPVEVWPVGMPVDLDRHAPHGDVEVVRADRSLSNRFEPSAPQGLDELLLVGADVLTQILLLPPSDAVSREGTSASPPVVSSDRRPDALHALLRRHPGRAEQPSVAHPPHRGATLLQESPDSRLRAPEGLSQHSLGVSSLVSLDEVVDVDVIAFRGHVYDLSTTSHWFLADGLIVHNSARDERVRNSHRETDGQAVPANLRFKVPKVATGNDLNDIRFGFDLARFPRDPDLPIGNRIHCRCEDPIVPGLLAASIHRTDVNVTGTRVSGQVETRFPRAAESNNGTSGDDGTHFMDGALAAVAARLRASQA